MYFEINVSLWGRHVFATAPRSLTGEQAAKTLFEDFVERFPAAEGFTITCSRIEVTGREVDWA